MFLLCRDTEGQPAPIGDADQSHNTKMKNLRIRGFLCSLSIAYSVYSLWMIPCANILAFIIGNGMNLFGFILPFVKVAAF
jgi:hypothetical protein